MAAVIVYNIVWDRVNEYYNNVERKYPNTWNLQDTLSQISKIQDVVTHFDKVAFWKRDSIRKRWRDNGWSETFEKGVPWHFAFTQENGVYYIHDIEHEDVMEEMSLQKALSLIERMERIYNSR